jgi:putative transposase
VFAGQLVGVRQESDRIWLVSFMHYDLGYFDDETCRLEPIQNPFEPPLSPIHPV